MARWKSSASSRARRARAGLTLLESTAVLSLCGVLAAVFIPTFYKHLRFSKIAEASERLDLLYRSTAAYYATPQRGASGLLRGCLPESAAPTPALPSVDPVLVDFDADDLPSRATWRALGQSGSLKLRYSYELTVAEPGCGPRAAPSYPAVLFRAWGDLDGDGTTSLLERSASLSSDQRALLPVVPLRIVQRVE